MSHYKFYPDKYQRMLFGASTGSTAAAVSFAFSIAAIPAAYMMGARLTRRRLSGLSTAMALALSYSHVVWGGFNLTEAAGVFILLSLLLALLYVDDNTSILLPIGTGVLFALAVFTRYEYIVLIIPVVLWYRWRSLKPVRRGGIFLGAAIGIFSLSWILMQPLLYSKAAYWAQMQRLAFLFPLSIAVLFACAHLVRYLRLPRIQKIIHDYSAPKQQQAKGLAIIGLLILAAVILIPFQGLYTFARHDFLIVILSCFGIRHLLRNTRQHHLGYFVLISCALQAASYYRINRHAEHTMVLLIPFLLIPATYGGMYVYQSVVTLPHRKKVITLLVTLSIIMAQIIVSYREVRI